MHSESYDDPPLWTLLDEIARWNRGDLTMSHLARQVKTSTGYAGAYRAIGRLVAAGYAEYDMPVGAEVKAARISVRLSARGRLRWGLGKAWPEVAAREIRARDGAPAGAKGLPAEWARLRPARTP